MDGVAHQRVLADQGPADVPRDGETRIDPAVDAQWRWKRALAAERLDALADLEGGVHGRSRCALERDRHAEQRHHAVAEVLLDGAAVALGDGAHLGQEGAHDGVGCGGIHLLGHGREAGQVGEQDRGTPPFGVARVVGPRARALGIRAHGGGHERREHELSRIASRALQQQLARARVDAAAHR